MCFVFNIANQDTILCRVPSHLGITDEEMADSAAKSALDLPRFKVGVPTLILNI